MMVLKGSKDWSAVPMDAFSPQVLPPPPPPDRRAAPPHCCCRHRTAAVLGWWMTNGGWAGIVPNHVNCQAFLPPHYTNRGPTPLMTKNDTFLEQRHIVDEWIKKKLGAILVEINFWNWISVLLESLKVEDRFWNQAKNRLKSSHSMTQQFDIKLDWSQLLQQFISQCEQNSH